jgi:hypothetical protein
MEAKDSLTLRPRCPRKIDGGRPTRRLWGWLDFRIDLDLLAKIKRTPVVQLVSDSYPSSWDDRNIAVKHGSMSTLKTGSVWLAIWLADMLFRQSELMEEMDVAQKQIEYRNLICGGSNIKGSWRLAVWWNTVQALYWYEETKWIYYKSKHVSLLIIWLTSIKYCLFSSSASLSLPEQLLTAIKPLKAKGKFRKYIRRVEEPPLWSSG